MPRIFREPDISLAYEYLPGQSPVTIFCSGYASDMNGTKALALEAWCRTHNRAMLRLDYSGHGQSGGDFLSGTLGSWTADAAHIIAQTIPASEPIILVGSSMGGWISLLIGRTLGPRLTGLILIAPAPDFTELLLRPSLTPPQWAELHATGVLYEPSEYGDPLPWTLKFLEDGANHLVLNAPIPITCPVRILHGMQDSSVPWSHSLKITEALQSNAVKLTYLKDGDHRLSRPADLHLLCETLSELLP